MDRVQKILSMRGHCSRRKAEDLIKKGKVKVNGKVISIGDKAEENDKITVDGKDVRKQNKIYLAFHKPVGCVTALKDQRMKTVMDYIKIKERVYPVGRLDYDTSGLLIMTNDGEFANKVMHPRYETEKTYLVELDKVIFDKKIIQIEKGIRLEDGKTAPAKVRKRKPNVIEITIHEGKNRIVRRMMEKIGFDVVSLKRIKIGELILGRLKEGEYRELADSDLKKLM